jgi:hypothetical protein
VVDAGGGFTYTPNLRRGQAGPPQSAARGHLRGDCRRRLSRGQDGDDGDRGDRTDRRTEPTSAVLPVNPPEPKTGRVIGFVSGFDAQDDPLTYSGSRTTTKGAVTVDPDGTLSYLPTPQARHTAAADNAQDADKADKSRRHDQRWLPRGTTAVPVKVTGLTRE